MQKRFLNLSTRDITYLSLFVALIYIGGLIKIPAEIPFTLQTLCVMLAGALLGFKRSIICVITYIIMGLAGIPVFAGGGGLGYVMRPTFGYILAFLPAAALTGWVLGRSKRGIAAAAAVFAVTACIMLVIGSLYAFLVLTNITAGMSLWQVMAVYAVPFIWAEVVKSVAASIIYVRIPKIIYQNNYGHQR